MTTIIKDNVQMLQQAKGWLVKSYDRCKHCSLDGLDEGSLVEFEALASRFGRVVDILIQKVYRSIDYVELETQGSLIDVVNRAHKRGIVNDVGVIREFKDLRNSIAHEYREVDLAALFGLILRLTPLLLEHVEKAEQYVASNIS